MNFKRGQTADESVALAISKAARLKRVAEVSVADTATVASKRRKKRIPSATQISVADTATLASAAAQSSVAVTATVASAAAQITVADAVEMKEEKAPSTTARAGEAALGDMQVLETAKGDKRTKLFLVASGPTTPPPRARTPALSPTIVVPLRVGPRAALPAAPGYLKDGSAFEAASVAARPFPRVLLPQLEDAIWNASRALRKGLGEDAGNRVVRGAVYFLDSVDGDRAEKILRNFTASPLAGTQADIDPCRPMSSPAVVSLLLLGRGMYDIEDRRLDILRLGTASETSILQLE